VFRKGGVCGFRIFLFCFFCEAITVNRPMKKAAQSIPTIVVVVKVISIILFNNRDIPTPLLTPTILPAIIGNKPFILCPPCVVFKIIK